jgi:hypothetical protein
MEVREGGLVDKDSFKIFEAGLSFALLVYPLMASVEIMFASTEL